MGAVSDLQYLQAVLGPSAEDPAVRGQVIGRRTREVAPPVHDDLPLLPLGQVGPIVPRRA